MQKNGNNQRSNQVNLQITRSLKSIKQPKRNNMAYMLLPIQPVINIQPKIFHRVGKNNNVRGCSTTTPRSRLKISIACVLDTLSTRELLTDQQGFLSKSSLTRRTNVSITPPRSTVYSCRSSAYR
jgi:hypothetical protein